METGPLGRAGIAGSDVVELRRYRLHRGTLPTLVDVFERHLVEPQEEQGMRVGGIFADEDDPDAFVWFRGFPGHADRVRSLESFYGGPVWARHRAAANATMVSSDDVLLLRPTDPAHRPPTAVLRCGRDAAPSLERLYVSVYRHSGDGAVESWLSTQVHTNLEHLLASNTCSAEPWPPGAQTRRRTAFRRSRYAPTTSSSGRPRSPTPVPARGHWPASGPRRSGG